MIEVAVTTGQNGTMSPEEIKGTHDTCQDEFYRNDPLSTKFYSRIGALNHLKIVFDDV